MIGDSAKAPTSGENQASDSTASQNAERAAPDEPASAVRAGARAAGSAASPPPAGRGTRRCWPPGGSARWCSARPPSCAWGTARSPAARPPTHAEHEPERPAAVRPRSTRAARTASEPSASASTPRLNTQPDSVSAYSLIVRLTGEISAVSGSRCRAPTRTAAPQRAADAGRGQQASAAQPAARAAVGTRSAVPPRWRSAGGGVLGVLAAWSLAVIGPPGSGRAQRSNGSTGTERCCVHAGSRPCVDAVDRPANVRGRRVELRRRRRSPCDDGHTASGRAVAGDARHTGWSRMGDSCPARAKSVQEPARGGHTGRPDSRGLGMQRTNPPTASATAPTGGRGLAAAPALLAVGGRCCSADARRPAAARRSVSCSVGRRRVRRRSSPAAAAGGHRRRLGAPTLTTSAPADDHQQHAATTAAAAARGGVAASPADGAEGVDPLAPIGGQRRAGER